MLEWQRHKQDFNAVPDFDKLLEFLDLRARGGENAAREGERRRQAPSRKKRSQEHHIQVA